MNEKLKSRIDEFLKQKGYVHEETIIQESYRCDKRDLDNLYGGRPKEKPDGDALYERKEKVSVIDPMSDEEVERTVRIEQQQTIDRLTAMLEKSADEKTKLLQENVNDTRKIRKIAVFFMVLAIIDLAFNLTLVISILGLASNFG